MSTHTPPHTHCTHTTPHTLCGVCTRTSHGSRFTDSERTHTGATTRPPAVANARRGQPPDLICYRHCTVGMACGRVGPARTPDYEAVLQRVCSCAAQPECSTKEPPTALLLRHEVDRLGGASSASNKSGSCASLLSLHASVGATICGARTDASTQLERVARCRLRFSAPHRQA